MLFIQFLTEFQPLGIWMVLINKSEQMESEARQMGAMKSGAHEGDIVDDGGKGRPKVIHRWFF